MYQPFYQKVEHKMSKMSKVLFATVLFVSAFAQDQIRECFHSSEIATQEESISERSNTKYPEEDIAQTSNRPANTLKSDLQAGEDFLDFDENKETGLTLTESTDPSLAHQPLKEPIIVNWFVLMDIEYKLKYFEMFDAEIYAPIFTKAVEALDGKEVVIEGFVIPLDDQGNILSLSYNPYASCFFCGNASAASVISLYLKDKGQRYKVDDYRKFRGTFFLNHDNPDEFYYILRDAEEE